MRFSHIIVTKNRPASLLEALQGIRVAIPEDGEIIVVDGDPERSGERDRATAEGRDGGAPIHYIAGVSGICSQRNAGLDAASVEVAAFTDDDCVPTSGFYEALTQGYEDPSVVGVTRRVLQRQTMRIGSDVHSPLRRMVLGAGRQGSMTRFGFRRPIVDLDTRRSIEFMPGANMSARRASAIEVGFDEHLQHLGGYAARMMTSPTACREGAGSGIRLRLPFTIAWWESKRGTGASSIGRSWPIAPTCFARISSRPFLPSSGSRGSS